MIPDARDMVLVYRMTRDAEYTKKDQRNWVQKKLGDKFQPEPIDAMEKFHSMCNSVWPTVTILKADTDACFGGYTDIPQQDVSVVGKLQHGQGNTFLFKII